MAKLIQLDNGLRVVLEPMSYLKSAAAGILIRAGSVDETAETNGIAHLLEHMLFQGTASRSAKWLTAEIAAIGDDLNAYTSEEYTEYYGVTVSEELPTMLELLSDMLLHPRLANEDIRKEKKVILEEIDMYEDSPDDLVHELLQCGIWKSHPLGFPVAGTKERVRRLDREALLQFWNVNYVPERMVLSVAGAFHEEEILAKINEQFGSFRHTDGAAAGKESERAALAAQKLLHRDEVLFQGPYSRQYKPTGKKPPVYRQCICTRNKEFEQLHLNLAVPAIPAGHRDTFAFLIVNSILGGSNNSRLFQRIREELGLAYSVYSYGSAFLEAGSWHMDLTVNPAQGERVLGVVKEIIDGLSERRITEEELNVHRKQLRIETILGNESAKAKMSGQAKRVFVYGRIVPIEECLSGLGELTIEQVNTFAASYLRPERASLSIVGSAKTSGFPRLKRYFERTFLK